MRLLRVACNAALLALLTCAVIAEDFGYGGREGPAHWGESFKRCSGKHQSPINIDALQVVPRRFREFQIHGLERVPRDIKLTNNGHTVLVNMYYNDNMEPHMSNGPLRSDAVHVFEQFHFHWGINDSMGSEDTINNRAYPAELHVVIRSMEYTNFSQALGQDHGIAVFAFFFKITQADNPNYVEFTKKLQFIKRKGESVDLDTPISLGSFISTDVQHYYSYVGSLTTPPCSEAVVWVDFEKPIEISEFQLQFFRQLTASDEHLRNNFRPTQPLNNRTVFRNIPPEPPKPNESENAAGQIARLGIGGLLGLSLLTALELKGRFLVAFN
ncbi:carbonic anhydrase 2 [Drosophila busckii]|uniref:carbonic anhydrase 2 n=1 Tax=Drosophila busckii TaxID=30019 RepID=UPI0014331B3D|nr:carbonic anhydrase 2 [Drosophila busckii]